MRLLQKPRWKWWIADQLDRLGGQCWADLVGWVLHTYREDPDWRSAVPWRPIGESCHKDAAACGRCYCGKLAADGSTLRHGETVPVPEPEGDPT